MSKLDVGVGDEFPVGEPVPPSPGLEEVLRAAGEEWQSQKEEWRRRRSEWHAQRDAWKADWRERRDAFKADVHSSFHQHFGSWGRVGLNPIILSGVAAVGLVIVMIALLPLLLLLVPVVVGALLILAVHHWQHHYPATGSQPSEQK